MNAEDRTHKKKRKRKLLLMLRMHLIADGYKKAEILKKKHFFAEFGERNYWYPHELPADPEMIRIHNNVKIAANVYFCTHDVLHNLFADDPNIKADYFKRYTDEIEIFDNVFIGSGSTIMYGVRIGPNAIVAAGSVITKDVPPGTVVGGNPPRVIGRYRALVKKRRLYTKGKLEAPVKRKAYRRKRKRRKNKQPLPQQTAKQKLKQIPEQAPEQTPKKAPEQMPKKLPEQTPDRH